MTHTCTWEMAGFVWIVIKRRSLSEVNRYSTGRKKTILHNPKRNDKDINNTLIGKSVQGTVMLI